MATLLDSIPTAPRQGSLTSPARDCPVGDWLILLGDVASNVADSPSSIVDMWLEVSEDGSETEWRREFGASWHGHDTPDKFGVTPANGNLPAVRAPILPEWAGVARIRLAVEIPNRIRCGADIYYE